MSLIILQAADAETLLNYIANIEDRIRNLSYDTDPQVKQQVAAMNSNINEILIWTEYVHHEFTA